MMKQALAVALVVLSLSHIVSEIAAQNSTSPVQAAVQGKPGDGYVAGSPAGPDATLQTHEPQYETEEDEQDCPQPQPADDVREVFMAYGGFVWRDLAAKTHQEPMKPSKSFAHPHMAETLPASIFARVAALKNDKKVYATTQAVASNHLLFPTSLGMEGDGRPGTLDLVNYPPSEALAVGHHPTDEDLTFVLHAINAHAEIFPMEKGGTPVEQVTPTKVSLMDLAAATGLDLTNLQISRLAAFYDHIKCRYVLMFTTAATGPVESTPPIFVATSLSDNPLSAWVIWALDLKPSLAAGSAMCADQQPEAFHLGQLQASYSKDGLFIGTTAVCALGDNKYQKLAVLNVLSKEALCNPPEPEEPDRQMPKVYAAMYFASRAWYRSITDGELQLIDDKYESFNSHITPARPQETDDAHKTPLFVMKVSQTHMSVASLTDEPLDKLCDLSTAPMLKAVVVGKGADFSNEPGYQDGSPLIPQPQTEVKLAVQGLGMPENNGGVVYWATQYKDLLYIVSGEFWGVNETRVPAIYWAILKPTEDICYLTREDQGMVASAEGLSLAYPVIAGRPDGGAVLAYSFSGPTVMAGGRFPAFPGVATTVVGGDSYGPHEGGIDVVQRGPGSLTDTTTYLATNGSLPWGYNSAAHVCGDEMWFAVPITTNVPSRGIRYGSWLGYKHL